MAKKAQEIQGCIYTLTNLINNKCYVGQHKNVLTFECARLAGHICIARRQKSKMYVSRAMHYYGTENFVPKIIWTGLQELLNEKETYYIKRLHSFVDDVKGGGYNLTLGGGANGSHSKRTKKKMSVAAARWQAALGDEERAARKEMLSEAQLASYKKNPARRIALRAAQQRRFEKFTERAKISAGQLRRFESPEAREKLRAAHLGVKLGPHSAAHNAAIGDGNRGKKRTPEQIKRLSDAHLGQLPNRGTTGMKFSKEIKVVMSAAQQRRRASSLDREKTGKASKKAWSVKTVEERHEIAMRIVATRTANALEKKKRTNGK